jgi:hypothetical protein
MNDNDSTADGVLAVVGGLLVIVVLGLIVWGVIRWIKSYPTTYCTEWTRVVSITPTNHDNGKYSDEQYIVKYADGSVDGYDQGTIPFARCTHKVSTTNPPQKNWKIVSPYGTVDWEQ